MQFYGVAHMPLIDTEDDERPDGSYIAIGRMCNGAPVLFKKGSQKFAVYYPEDGEIYDGFTYEDFYDFLDISMTCSEWTARMVAMTGMMTRTGTGTKTVKMMTTIRMKGNLSHL